MARNIFARAVERIVGTPTPESSVINQWLAPRVYDRNQLLDYFTGYVHAAITPLAEEVSAAEFFINQVDRKTGDTKQLFDTSFIKLLDEPNSLTTKSELLEGTAIYYLMFGEAFWIVGRGENTGLPVNLTLASPLALEPKTENPDGTGKLVGWKARNSKGEETVFELNEIIQFKTFNPRDRFRGWGILQAALQHVLIEKYGSEFTANFLANNAFPGGVFTIKQDIGKPAFKKFVNQLRQAYQGTRNAGKIMVLKNAEGSFEKMGANLADVGLKDLKVLSSEVILNMFRVPKQVLGIPDNINLATSQVLDKVWMKRVDKIINKFEDRLQKLANEYADSVNKRRVNKVNYVLEHEPIVPEDQGEKLTRYQRGLQDGWMTTNEVRKLEGLPPIENGDNILVDSRKVPLGSPVEQEQRSLPAGKVTVSKQSGPSLDDFMQYRRDKWTALKSSSVEIRGVLSTFYQQQLKAMRTRIKPKHLKKTNKAFDDVLYDVAAETRRFTEAMHPAFKDVSKQQYHIGQSFGAKGTKAAKGKTYADVETQIDEFVSQRTGLFAQGSMERNRKTLEKVLAQAAADGASPEETTSRLRDAFSQITSAQAARIAATELNAIANFAASRAFREQGYSYEVWFAYPNACEFCREMDGKVVGIDADFVAQGETMHGVDGGTMKNDFADIERPPGHANCKCDVLPSFEAKLEIPLGPIDERENVSAGI